MRCFIFIFSFFYFYTFSQETKFPNLYSFKSEKFSVEKYDTSILNVFYSFKSKNPQRPNYNIESLCILQIGDNFSKFCDYNIIKKDSLLQKLNEKNVIIGNDISKLENYKEKWPVINLKNDNTKSIIYQNRVRNRYEYGENQPSIVWTLDNSTKKVLGYICNRATARYRGRNYIAWYTTDISKNNGPYIFEGLPGLILEISDDEDYVHFSAVAINDKSMEIYLRNEKSIIKTSRKKFREVQKSYFENPGVFYGNAYNEDGSPMVVKPRASIPYNPMELE